MSCMKLSYDNTTHRYIIQRKLKQLEHFDFIMIKIKPNESLRGWGHRIFKAKKKCKKMLE